MGIAEELRADGIASNTFWPRALIATAAVRNLLGGQDSADRSRTPETVADAAHVVLTAPAAQRTGRTLIDDEVLAETGTRDLSR